VATFVYYIIFRPEIYLLPMRQDETWFISLMLRDVYFLSEILAIFKRRARNHFFTLIALSNFECPWLRNANQRGLT